MKNPNNRVGLASVSRTVLGQIPYGRQDVIEELVRDCLLQAGLGQKNPDVPLADIIQPGSTILVKPNWVLHYNQSNQGMECMVTHPTFVLAALKEVFAAKPERVILGDAPIQGCIWKELITEEFCREVALLSQSTRVDLVDFRRTILSKGNLIEGRETNVHDESRYVLFDLGPDSLLEPISRPEGRFRVTMYDPSELATTHRPGRHQYLLCREAFEADVILNLPKLKTHCKAGLTAALKNLVGLNGNKEYLPHHRVGGSTWGGDCYPGMAPLKRVAEHCLDMANKNIGQPVNGVWTSRAHRLLGYHKRIFGDCQIEGSWWGNDTVWRMVLDLNRILLYGRLDGSMAEVAQRRIWSLTDAVVCGEGEGPLAPTPRLLGAATFSESAPAADMVHAALLGLDPQRISLLREALGRFRWPLVPDRFTVDVHFENRQISLAQTARALGVNAKPPRYWVGKCEMKE
jgi:uncharacterized protein (DUF362 family)